MLQAPTGTRWFAAPEWRWIQAAVPIICVDVLPLRFRAAQVAQLGLIFRETPHQGPRWCLLGGRMLRGESFAEATTRQLLETVGHGVRFTVSPDEQPLYVAQYFTDPREVGGWDSRQHAIGVTFAILLEGSIQPQGEAIRFEWFAANELPPADEFGFGQDKVVAACLARLDKPSKSR